jgi:hypothetical protein
MKLKRLEYKNKNLRDNQELLDLLTTLTNRSKQQTLFLFDLLDGDFDKLVLLEEKIKKNFLSYCPGDKEECEKVLSMDFKYGDNFENSWGYNELWNYYLVKNLNKRVYPKDTFKFYNNGYDNPPTEPKSGMFYYNRERRFPWFKNRFYEYIFLQNRWVETGNKN